MRRAAARALLALAASCLGESRRFWARAMEGELEAAFAAGRPVAFAAGCLVAALRQMPRQAEGRFVLASHALALGLLVPMAGLLLASAAGLPFPLWSAGAFYSGPAAGSVQDLYLYEAFTGAAPALLGLSLFLALLQLRFAWLLLDGDRDGVARIGAMFAASTAALAIFSGVLFLDGKAAALHSGVLAVDLLAALAATRWRRRVFPGGLQGAPR